MEFILKLVTPNRFTTGTISQRVTRLQHLTDVSTSKSLRAVFTHKLLDDTMEDDPVVVAILGVGNKVFDRLWYQIGVQFKVLEAELATVHR
jgi:hypothetical protein